MFDITRPLCSVLRGARRSNRYIPRRGYRSRRGNGPRSAGLGWGRAGRGQYTWGVPAVPVPPHPPQPLRLARRPASPVASSATTTRRGSLAKVIPHRPTSTFSSGVVAKAMCGHVQACSSPPPHRFQVVDTQSAQETNLGAGVTWA